MSRFLSLFIELHFPTADSRGRAYSSVDLPSIPRLDLSLICFLSSSHCRVPSHPVLGRSYLDLPDGGEGEDETSADGDGVNHVDDDEKVPETTSVVSRQERVEHDSLKRNGSLIMMARDASNIAKFSLALISGTPALLTR